MSRPLSTDAAVRAVRFAERPAVGFQLEVGRARQAFTVTGYEPYTRKDGAETLLVLWTSPCAECGAPFTVKSCQTSINSQFGNRRCEAHRKPMKKVRK